MPNHSFPSNTSLPEERNYKAWSRANRRYRPSLSKQQKAIHQPSEAQGTVFFPSVLGLQPVTHIEVPTPDLQERVAGL